MSTQTPCLWVPCLCTSAASRSLSPRVHMLWNFLQQAVLPSSPEPLGAGRQPGRLLWTQDTARTYKTHQQRTHASPVHEKCFCWGQAQAARSRAAAMVSPGTDQTQPLGPQPGCGHGASNTCQNEELRWVPASMACAPNKIAQASKAVSLSCTSAHSLSARMHGCRHMQWSGSTT